MDYKSQKSSSLPTHRSYPSFGERVPLEALVSLGDARCDVCFDLNIGTNGQNDIVRPAKMNFYEALESESYGCRFCALICQGLRAFDAEIHDNSPIITISAINGNPFYVQWDDQVTQWSTLEIFATPGGSAIIPELGERREVEADPGADSCYELIQSWQTICERDHLQCRSPPSGVQPHRLVKISFSDCGLMASLVETYPEGARYVALSHCWGTARTFQTEISSLQHRKAGIDWTDLPKTFQDAITITSKLGFEYIWIDSLCIVQDDRNDWETESAIMGAIYEGSQLTIAASLSPDDQTGFLGTRLTHRAIDIKWEGSDISSGIKVRKAHDVREQLQLEALSKRAWTLQERLLPTRLLSYSSAITWECVEASWCECGSNLTPNPFLGDKQFGSLASRPIFRNISKPSELDENLIPGPIRKTSKVKDFIARARTKVGLSASRTISTGINDNAKLDEQLRASLFWKTSIVEDFTTRAITKEEDFLPAVSAIAKKIHLATGDQYLAGIWKSSLVADLTWFHLTTVSNSSVTTGNYRAPSWSWASSSSVIYQAAFFAKGSQDFVEVLDVGVTSSGFNEFGTVKDGFLRLRGTVLRANFLNNKISFDPEVYVPGIDPYHIIFRRDNPLENSNAKEPGGYTYRSVRRRRGNSEHSGSNVSGEVLCLLIRKFRFSSSVAYVCLILGGLESPPGTYERIGLILLHQHLLQLGGKEFVSPREILIL